MRAHGLQHARLLCLPLSPGVCSNLCPLSQWCYLTITFFVAPFSFAFNLSQHQGLFQWLTLRTRWPRYWTFSFSISPSNNIQGWFPLGLTGLLKVQETLKRLLQHNSKACVLRAQLSIWSNSHVHTWLQEKPWRAAVYGVTKSRTQLSDWTEQEKTIALTI